MPPQAERPGLLSRVRTLAEQGPPQAATSAVHDERVVARVGRWLGIAFAVCFATGVLSHLHQNPVAWLPLGPTPSWGYRLTQGLHVATGLACVPLLLAKLYAAYPRLFAWPPVTGLVNGLERGSIGVLVGSALFQVSTGVMNILQWYPWGFGFTGVHWAVAWVTIGALVVHIAVHLPAIRRGLGTALDAPAAVEPPTFPAVPGHAPPDPEDDATAGRTRRGFLVGTGLAVAAITVTTVGQTAQPLSRLAVLAPRRPDLGPQGLPVNRTAAQAGVERSAVDPAWVLRLLGPAGEQGLDLQALQGLDQHEAELTITCVEGWSASALWSGVPVAQLVSRAGGGRGSSVRVTSLEPRGAYRVTTLPASYAFHPDTLLALRLEGQDLDLDHGYPARIIAPNRPGVLQTKWVTSLEVLDA